jgi:hypothetical protein
MTGAIRLTNGQARKTHCLYRFAENSCLLPVGQITGSQAEIDSFVIRNRPMPYKYPEPREIIRQRRVRIFFPRTAS